MAARLVVVLSQSPNSAPNRRHAEEELIARFMFEPGVDINVIPPLEHLDADSTGLLCLEGIKGDMVILTWNDPATTLSQLSEFGVAGRRGQTTFDSNDAWSSEVADDAGQLTRAIYCLDLRGEHETERLLSEVRRIRDDARVQIFSILDNLSTLEQSTAGSRSAPSARPVAAKAAAADGPKKQAVTHDASHEPRTVPDDSTPSPTTNRREEGWSEARLDNLLDDLDAFDS